MKFILFLKAWQIFLIIFLGQFLGGSTFNLSILDDILPILGFVIYFIYHLTIAIYLIEYLPKKIELSNTFFAINFFIVIASFSTILILYGRNEVTFQGLIIFPFFYALFASLYIFSFPAKILKSLELKKEASFGEYFGDFFLFFFFPIGIWFLQPRVKKIIDSNKS